MSGKTVLETEGLRARNGSIQSNGGTEIQRVVLHLNAREERTEKEDKDKKTFGRTPDGTGKGHGHRAASSGLLQLCLHLEKLIHSIQSSRYHIPMTWSHSYCPLPNPRTFPISLFFSFSRYIFWPCGCSQPAGGYPHLQSSSPSGEQATTLVLAAFCNCSLIIRCSCAGRRSRTSLKIRRLDGILTRSCSGS
jgi:hypothetical protein